jgi:hypothetical protein
MQISSIAGSSETAQTELQVRPRGMPSESVTVTTETPEGNEPMIDLKVMWSIVAYLLTSK